MGVFILITRHKRVADTVNDTFNGGCVLRNYLSAWSLLTLSMCCCYIFSSYNYLFPGWYYLGSIRNNAISTLTPRMILLAILGRVHTLINHYPSNMLSHLSFIMSFFSHWLVLVRLDLSSCKGRYFLESAATGGGKW